MLFLFKLTNVIAAVIGIIQALIPLVKELIITAGRILNVFYPKADWDDKLIEKVNHYFGIFCEYFEKFKKVFLDIAKEKKNET